MSQHFMGDLRILGGNFTPNNSEINTDCNSFGCENWLGHGLLAMPLTIAIHVHKMAAWLPTYLLQEST